MKGVLEWDVQESCLNKDSSKEHWYTLFLDSPINILTHSTLSYGIYLSIYVIASEPIEGKLHTSLAFAPTYFSVYFRRIFFYTITILLPISVNVTLIQYF